MEGPSTKDGEHEHEHEHEQYMTTLSQHDKQDVTQPNYRVSSFPGFGRSPVQEEETGSWETPDS